MFIHISYPFLHVHLPRLDVFTLSRRWRFCRSWEKERQKWRCFFWLLQHLPTFKPYRALRYGALCGRPIGFCIAWWYLDRNPPTVIDVSTQQWLETTQQGTISDHVGGKSMRAGHVPLSKWAVSGVDPLQKQRRIGGPPGAWEWYQVRSNNPRKQQIPNPKFPSIPIHPAILSCEWANLWDHVHRHQSFGQALCLSLADWEHLLVAVPRTTGA